MGEVDVLFENLLAGGCSTCLTSRLWTNRHALGEDFQYRTAGQDRSCK